MAFINIKLRSETLGLCTEVSVILPESRSNEKPLKVLWLLHGYSDDHTAWCRQTSVERYVEGRNLCVIMPAVDLSFYTDMAFGNRYYAYVSKELPDIMQKMLPISSKKEDNFVAGLSMGGYGAFKLALNQPERFAAAASFSGALDMEAIYDDENPKDEKLMRQIQLIYDGSDKFSGSINDLRHMAEIRKDDAGLPKLYMCCGKDDFLYKENQDYLAHLKSLGIPVTYEEEAGYGHEWAYWDMKIQRALEWMGL